MSTGTETGEGSDDQDCVWLRVEIPGEALEFLEHEKAFDPKAVYGDAPNPTQL